MDRAASPFADHRCLFSGNGAPVSSALPPFYLSSVKPYRRSNGADRTSPSTLSEATSQSLFGNPNITDPNGKPFYSRSMATAGLYTVVDLRENNRWKEIAQLQQRYRVGPYFLKGFVRTLHTAIPAVWFTLPNTEATPSVLSTLFPLKSPIPLSSQRMYVQMAKCRYVRPLAKNKWTLPSWSEGWSTACSTLQDARLDTPYSNDIAFKFLHRVLPTPDRLTLFRPFQYTSCDSCDDARADLEHSFARCPSARSFQLSLRRILTCFLSNVPSDVTLLTALFLCGLSQSSSASFIVWTFIAFYWQHRNSLNSNTILSVTASAIRRRIVEEWHEARLHRPPRIDFFLADGDHRIGRAPCVL